MSRRGGVHDWLADRAEFLARGAEPVLPKPADLDRFEAQTGFLLPHDYRAFCLAFGYGTFRLGSPRLSCPIEVQIAVPGGTLSRFARDPRGLARTCHGIYYGADTAAFDTIYGDGARAVRLILFAKCGQFDHLGWDLTEPTGNPNGSCGAAYAIYRLSAHFRSVEPMDNSFTEATLGYCLAGAFRPDVPESKRRPVRFLPADRLRDESR